MSDHNDQIKAVQRALQHPMQPTLIEQSSLAQAPGSVTHHWSPGDIQTLCGIWMPGEYPPITMNLHKVTCTKCLAQLLPNDKVSSGD